MKKEPNKITLEELEEKVEDIEFDGAHIQRVLQKYHKGGIYIMNKGKVIFLLGTPYAVTNSYSNLSIFHISKNSFYYHKPQDCWSSYITRRFGQYISAKNILESDIYLPSLKKLIASNPNLFI